jgi:hypothetical protein
MSKQQADAAAQYSAPPASFFKEVEYGNALDRAYIGGRVNEFYGDAIHGKGALRPIDSGKIIEETKKQLPDLSITDNPPKSDIENNVANIRVSSLNGTGKMEESNSRNEPVKAEMTTKTATEKFSAIAEGVPAGRLDELITLTDEFAKQAQHEPDRPLPKTKEEMKDMGIEIYPAFKKRTDSTDGRRCLQENWGIYLKAFNPTLDRDHMSQADLGRLDKQLMERLRATYKAAQINEFIPNLQTMNKQDIALLTDKEIREFHKLNSLLHRHLYAA